MIKLFCTDGLPKRKPGLNYIKLDSYEDIR